MGISIPNHEEQFVSVENKVIVISVPNDEKKFVENLTKQTTYFRSMETEETIRTTIKCTRNPHLWKQNVKAL
jgi:hypothetical protein